LPLVDSALVHAAFDFNFDPAHALVPTSAQWFVQWFVHPRGRWRCSRLAYCKMVNLSLSIVYRARAQSSHAHAHAFVISKPMRCATLRVLPRLQRVSTLGIGTQTQSLTAATCECEDLHYYKASKYGVQVTAAAKASLHSMRPHVN